MSDEKQTKPTHLNFSTTQLLNIALATLLLGCAGSPHPQLVSPSEGPIAPRYLEIYSEQQVATLHFPPGVYTLDAVDKIGYYYQAPRKIAEHTGVGSFGREGGIFVSKRNPEKLRGYVFRAGTMTHVGNFSRAKHRLFDEPPSSVTSEF